jgi:hypothetical protein
MNGAFYLQGALLFIGATWFGFRGEWIVASREIATPWVLLAANLGTRSTRRQVMRVVQRPLGSPRAPMSLPAPERRS